MPVFWSDTLRQEKGAAILKWGGILVGDPVAKEYPETPYSWFEKAVPRWEAAAASMLERADAFTFTALGINVQDTKTVREKLEDTIAYWSQEMAAVSNEPLASGFLNEDSMVIFWEETAALAQAMTAIQQMDPNQDAASAAAAKFAAEGVRMIPATVGKAAGVVVNEAGKAVGTFSLAFLKEAWPMVLVAGIGALVFFRVVK